jgi:ATP synthase subunit 6
MGLLVFQPFEQFEIFVVGSLQPSFLPSVIFTNYLVYLVYVSLVVFFLFVGIGLLNPYRIVGYRWQVLSERIFVFISDLVHQQVGFIGQRFVPLFFFLFVFILTANMIGLVPFSFTLTSHIIMTFTLSFSVFLGLTILAIIYQPNFFSLFIPKGIPGGLVPFLFVIELISYVSRTFSLAIRLFANMMSGHVLLYILTGFCAYIFNDLHFLVGKVVFFVPFALVLAITALEIGISFLQAYVFCVLVSIYLCDVYVSH